MPLRERSAHVITIVIFYFYGTQSVIFFLREIIARKVKKRQEVTVGHRKLLTSSLFEIMILSHNEMNDRWTRLLKYTPRVVRWAKMGVLRKNRKMVTRALSQLTVHENMV